MVIKSVAGRVVDATDVGNDIELVKDFLLTASHDDAVSELSCLEQH